MSARRPKWTEKPSIETALQLEVDRLTAENAILRANVEFAQREASEQRVKREERYAELSGLKRRIRELEALLDGVVQNRAAS